MINRCYARAEMICNIKDNKQRHIIYYILICKRNIILTVLNFILCYILYTNIYTSRVCAVIYILCIIYRIIFSLIVFIYISEVTLNNIIFILII